MPAFVRLLDPRVFQAAGLLALVAGLCTWGQVLGTSPAVAMAAVAPQPAPPSPVSQWFDERPAPLAIQVSGLLGGARGAVAILAINGKPPRAYMAGETLAPRVRLLAVGAGQVTIERDGERQLIPISRVPPAVPLPVLTAH